MLLGQRGVDINFITLQESEKGKQDLQNIEKQNYLKTSLLLIICINILFLKEFPLTGFCLSDFSIKCKSKFQFFQFFLQISIAYKILSPPQHVLHVDLSNTHTDP
jgi:hypothetical protein